VLCLVLRTEDVVGGLPVCRLFGFVRGQDVCTFCFCKLSLFPFFSFLLFNVKWGDMSILIALEKTTTLEWGTPKKVIESDEVKY
jgi:hypothetical protein